MLPAATEAAWTAFREREELGGLILVGGTALALRIGHRLSYDLDFACVQDRLPSRRIQLAVDHAARSGLECSRHDDPAAVAEFIDSGLELHDYQQDFLVGGAKVSFFAVDAPTRRILTEPTERVPRVATLAEIFATKALVSAQRSRTRDWFDLWVLIRDHDFSLRDYVAVFERAGARGSCDIGLDRLCSGRPERADEGFQTLITNPPGIEDLAAFFTERRDQLEATLAAEKLS